MFYLEQRKTKTRNLSWSWLKNERDPLAIFFIIIIELEATNETLTPNINQVVKVTLSFMMYNGKNIGNGILKKNT